MRNLKKVLALVVAFSMMLSVVAFAGFGDVAADADYAGAVELLSALDIMVGDDLGNFNPDKTISRAEMAAIVCRIKGLEGAAKGAQGATAFTDVAADHWASGYVNMANQNGIINGYGDGKFGPEDEVSYEAAVKMIVCALGFEPMAAQKGGWPTGYLVVANSYKITEGVSGSTRADVAVLVANALSTPMMDQTTYGADAEFEILDGKKDRDYRTLLTDMDIYVATGIVMDTEKAEELAYFTATEDSDDLEFEEEEEYEFEINGSNIGDYQFQSVDVYVKKDARKDYQVVAVVPGVVGETFALLSDDIKASDDKVVEYYVDPANSSKTKEIKVELTTIVYNKQVVDTLDLSQDDIELVYIENTGDTKYDVLVATKYTSEKLTYVDADKNKISLAGKTVELDFEDEDKTYILVDQAGNELTLADFAEDDVIAFVMDADKPANAEYIKIIKLADAAITGIVEEYYESNDDYYAVIDGEEYKIDPAGTDVDDIAVSAEGIFYVGMTGKIIYFDGDGVSKNYGYILEAALSDSSFTADKWQVKLLTKENGVVIYDTTDDITEKFVATFGDTLDEDGEVVKGLISKNSKGEDIIPWSIEANAMRLVTYKTNAKGQIKTLAIADGTLNKIDSTDKEYNDKTQMINDNTLEDDVVIFVVDEADSDDVTVADISYLVDEGEYEGAVFCDDDGECTAMIVTEGEGQFSVETGIAIVTKVTTTNDAEDNEVLKVTFVQDEEEATVIIDDDSTAKNQKPLYKKDKDDKDVAIPYEDLFAVGTSFIYTANADGVVNNYAILSVIDDKGAIFKLDTDGVNLGKDVSVVAGYISNTERKTTSKGETIVISGSKTISVAAASNKYTYNDAGRNTVIETGDFLAEDAYYLEEVTETIEDKEVDVTYVTPVLVRIVDGFVSDIYTSNERQILK